MPLIANLDYNPSGIFKNGHINSMFPYFFRKAFDSNFERQRLTTPDQDFLDIDLIINNNEKAVFLFHGLEGSTGSQYIQASASLFSKNGFDVIATNYRGCSGQLNHKPYAYNSGWTRDVEFVLDNYLKKYSSVVLLGYSLGGNLILKYASDGYYHLDPKIKAIMAVSAPIDLYQSVLEISKRKNRLYEINFLKTLKIKTHEKAVIFPEVYNKIDVDGIKKLIEFDDLVTGPIHGYEGALDYYEKCNSLQTLKNLSIPTLLLNAKDDPFLSKSCYPEILSKKHRFLHALFPKYGGHCGFYTKGESYYWNEIELLKFAKTQTEI